MPPRIVRHNPVELHKPLGYHRITVVESGRLAFLAGQCPIDASGALVGGGNIDRQIDQVAADAATALAAVGAKADHVVRSVIYVVRTTVPFSRRLAAAHTLRRRIGIHDPSTLLGVSRLGFTGQLVEVDLTAAL
jgi:enamine deaminase RidA (YjgF/YER057c/UK114 family)